eukprot:6177493-Pleurochrysis_carterae.AAC.6
MYKWGHLVDTLPNDEGDNALLLQSNVNSATVHIEGNPGCDTVSGGSNPATLGSNSSLSTVLSPSVPAFS